MNWDNLRFFLHLANRKTLSAAANELGVSHTTMIRRLDQLEAELKLKVFDRRHSGYRLTTEGEKLLRLCQPLQQSIHSIQRFSHSKDQQVQGLLRVSLPEAAVLNCSVALAQFQHLYPGIELAIVSSPDPANLNQVEADVALRLTNNPPQELIGRQVARITFAMYAHRELLDRLGRVADFSVYPWLVRQGAAVMEAGNLEQALSQDAPSARVVFRSNSTADVLGAIRAGMGVGVLSQSIAQQYPELEEVTSLAWRQQMGLWCLHHRDLRGSARISAFKDFLINNPLA